MIQTAMSQNEEQLPGPTGLSLRSNFAWSFTGNVIYMASQWAMLAVLAKLGSPETVGQFALGLAVTAPIILFTNLQLRAVIATDARNENTFSDYFTLRIATTIFSIFITLGLVFISDYSRQTALVILVIGIAKVFESSERHCLWSPAAKRADGAYRLVNDNSWPAFFINHGCLHVYLGQHPDRRHWFGLRLVDGFPIL